MKEERMMILNMVNEGKINADDAAKLMEAIGKASDPSGKKHQKPHYYYEGSFCCDDTDVEEKLSKFSKTVDNFSKDFGDKMSTIFKDVEPKFRKTSKTVLEKAACVVDDLSRNLNESLRNMEEKERGTESVDCECDSEADNDDKPKEN